MDILHILYLGVEQRLIAAVFWELLSCNPWNFMGAQSSVYDNCLKQIKSELMDWYSDNDIPGSERIRDLTMSMIGKDSRVTF